MFFCFYSLLSLAGVVQAQVLSLDDCVMLAMVSNKQIKATDHLINQYVHTQKSVYANFFPNINLNVADFYSTIQASSTMDMATQTQELAREKIIIEVYEAYQLLVKAKEMEVVAHKYDSLLTQLDHDVKSAVRHGMASHNDEMKVAVKKSDAELKIRQAENGIRLARMNLCQLIGKPLDAMIEPVLQQDDDIIGAIDKNANATDRTEYHLLELNTQMANGQPQANLDDATIFSMLPNLNTITDKEQLESAVKKGKWPQLTNTAQLAELSDGLRIEWEEPVIPRYNGKRVHTIEGSPAPGYGIEEARQILEKEIDKLQLPPGYEVIWGGEKKATDMSMENLFANYPLAILLMFGILVWLFRSYRTSLLLFCCIPFVFVGVIPAMLLSGHNFGFVAIVGVLGLVGMMLKNGIVLVDEMRLQLKSGKDSQQALIDASLSRLRPVTMASLTTVLGMIPLLFDDMFGSMAAAIMGGLIAGTIIVLIIIPVLYSLFYKLK